MKVEGEYRLPLKVTREKHIRGEEFGKVLERELRFFEIPSRVKEERNILSLVREKAQKYGVPVNIVLAVIEQESGFNPRAYNVNRDGTKDVGLMQVNFHHNERLMKEYGVSSPEDLFNPELNVELGVRILSENYRRYGSWELAIKAYNGIRADNWDYVKKVLKLSEKYVNI